MIEIAPLAVGAADLAIGTAAIDRGDVRLSIAPAATRYSLRARDAAGLSAAIGRALPERIGEVNAGIARLGPDEYYALLPADCVMVAVQGAPVSVVDISARAIGIVVEGAGAVAVVASGCPLDVERFAVGRATRTLFETVEIILMREDTARFRIEVWRSFAPWLWHALGAAIE